MGMYSGGDGRRHRVLVRRRDAADDWMARTAAQTLRDAGYEAPITDAALPDLAIPVVQEDVPTLVTGFDDGATATDVDDLYRALDQYGATVDIFFLGDDIGLNGTYGRYMAGVVDDPQDIDETLDAFYDWTRYTGVGEQTADLLDDAQLTPGHTTRDQVTDALEAAYGPGTARSVTARMDHDAFRDPV